MLPDGTEKKTGRGRGRTYRRVAALLVLTAILIPLPGPAAASDRTGGTDRKIPFAPGEKLTYEGKWGPLPAGDVTLEVLPSQTIGGAEAYHFTMVTRTNAAVDLFYPVRERQESFVDPQLTRSLLYRKRTESKHPRDVTVNFDWEKREATHTNFGRTSPPIAIPAGSFDPLALIYIIRLQNLAAGARIAVPVTDGHLNYAVKVTILKRETIEIQGRRQPAFEATIDMMELDKLVSKADDPYLRIWYSADEKKIPLRIRSKVGIVSFDFELVSPAY